jgi:ketosteroid isomerase-like protein
LVINDPAVILEVLALHQKYEAALMSNDVEKLTAFFWDSSQALRFGVAESLYGASEIEAFRKARSIINLEREVFNLHVVTFGDAFATVTLEFRRTANGIPRHGRQSQVWAKLPEGWKVVSAHVSFTPISYMESAAGLIGLPIPPEFANGVRQNIETSALIAAPLLGFPLSEEIESAQVFQP